MQQKYDPEEDIFFDVYSKADIDCLADDVKAKITDEKLLEVFDVMYKWATTDDFFDAVRIVVRHKITNKIILALWLSIILTLVLIIVMIVVHLWFGAYAR
jgi:hypothetical protein